MKFSQLPAGARFRYREVIYNKVSPLQGRAEGDDENAKKLIPRSAQVELLSANGEVLPTTLPESIASEALEAALDEFQTLVQRSLPQIDPTLTESQATQIQQRLEKARRRLTTRLALGKTLDEPL